MKYDMSGGATVIGTMRAIALLKPTVPVIGVVAAVENMPDGKAPAERRRNCDERQDHRDPEHRCRGTPHPRGRGGLRRDNRERRASSIWRL